MSFDKNVDWVKRRLNCSINEVWKRLCEQVKRDLESMNHSKSSSFEVNTLGDDSFEVIKKEISPAAILKTGISHVDWIRFSLITGEEEYIKVKSMKRGNDAINFKVKMGWDESETTCKLLIEEELLGEGPPVELWQISQRALSKLFFG